MSWHRLESDQPSAGNYGSNLKREFYKTCTNFGSFNLKAWANLCCCFFGGCGFHSLHDIINFDTEPNQIPKQFQAENINFCLVSCLAHTKTVTMFTLSTPKNKLMKVPLSLTLDLLKDSLYLGKPLGVANPGFITNIQARPVYLGFVPNVSQRQWEFSTGKRSYKIVRINTKFSSLPRALRSSLIV